MESHFLNNYALIFLLLSLIIIAFYQIKIWYTIIRKLGKGYKRLPFNTKKIKIFMSIYLIVLSLLLLFIVVGYFNKWDIFDVLFSPIVLISLLMPTNNISAILYNKKGFLVIDSEKTIFFPKYNYLEWKDNVTIEWDWDINQKLWGINICHYKLKKPIRFYINRKIKSKIENIFEKLNPKIVHL